MKHNNKLPKSKFRTRLYKASDEELVFRMLANEHLDSAAKALLLMDSLPGGEKDLPLLMSALEFGKKKVNQYYEQQRLDKAALAEGVIKDLKTILSSMELTKRTQDTDAAQPSDKKRARHS